MCIRDSHGHALHGGGQVGADHAAELVGLALEGEGGALHLLVAVSYTHLRAHETVLDLVCRLLLEKKK